MHQYSSEISEEKEARKEQIRTKKRGSKGSEGEGYITEVERTVF